jgi:uncharacterized protein (TIGR03437 family)
MSKNTRSAFVWLTGIAALLTPAFCVGQSFTISTVAGGANPYFYSGTGDGAPATGAGLANPCRGVAADGAGNLYIAAGALIRKVSPDGIVTTLAGGGSSVGEGVLATQAELSPVAIAADAAGNLYIADTAFGISRIRKVDTTGIINTVAGGAPCCALGDGGPATNAYLAVPYGLAVDAAGNLYIAQVDSNNNLIRKVSANGTVNTVAGGGPCCALGDGGPATGISLARPIGVAVDIAGNFYIAEANGNRVRKVAPGGIVTTLAGNGSANSAGDGGPAIQAGIDSPANVAADAVGNIYIAQSNDARVRMVTPDGTVATIAGNGTHGFSGDGGPAASATLDRPAGIAIDGQGQVYIADASSDIARVRLLTLPGPPPSIAPGGIVSVNGLSATIQPGSWVSIFGSNLAAATAIWNGDFPTSLARTSVIVDNKPAYLWFVSPGQINLEAPNDTATGVVNVVVKTSFGSASATVTLGQYAPAFNLFNTKYATAIVPTPGIPGNSGAGYDLIGPAGAFTFSTRPVKAGETLLLYGVGFGPTNPAVSAGKAFSGAAPSVSPPQIAIGGVPATVTFAGVVAAGLFQFNVIVPNAGSGDQPLRATVGGVATPNNVFITLQ